MQQRKSEKMWVINRGSAKAVCIGREEQTSWSGHNAHTNRQLSAVNTPGAKQLHCPHHTIPHHIASSPLHNIFTNLCSLTSRCPPRRHSGLHAGSRAPRTPGCRRPSPSAAGPRCASRTRNPLSLYPSRPILRGKTSKGKHGLRENKGYAVVGLGKNI